MGTACTYCGRDVTDHDAVYVTEDRTGDRDRLDPFCNYACLAAHIDAANLTDGAACRWR
ncbi:hypothetical protein [Halopiger djelfimassiliensis]|uniref:hypothetical protein n=1 Tax=Halopiger djelfimassiliensis TaxID=1293047 RepID=UPI000ADBAF15|nr:hypothetical protein [Halopiger djelfimassiliensis]